VASGTGGFIDVAAYRSRAADSSINAAQEAKPGTQASSFLFKSLPIGEPVLLLNKLFITYSDSNPV
jgi:hypothetical protein